MRKQKIEWRSIGIPNTVYNRIKELIVKTGEPSIAEYVRFAIKERMKYDEERIEADLSSTV